MKRLKAYVLSGWLLATVHLLYAQPYINEIRAFKEQDRLQPPPAGAILLIGSSSFRKWTDAESVFSRYPVINRGFGGSSFPDLIRYADSVIFPYRPRQVVVYCGDNDLAAADTVTARTVVARFKTFFGLLRSRMKDVPVAFVSIKPSPARKNLMPKMEAANSAIRQFLRTQKHTRFIDVYRPMLLADGYPNGALFESDSLHMLPAGYSIWQQEIEPAFIRQRSNAGKK